MTIEDKLLELSLGERKSISRELSRIKAIANSLNVTGCGYCLMAKRDIYKSLNIILDELSK